MVVEQSWHLNTGSSDAIKGIMKRAVDIAPAIVNSEGYTDIDGYTEADAAEHVRLDLEALRSIEDPQERRAASEAMYGNTNYWWYDNELHRQDPHALDH